MSLADLPSDVLRTEAERRSPMEDVLLQQESIAVRKLLRPNHSSNRSHPYNWLSGAWCDPFQLCVLRPAHPRRAGRRAAEGVWKLHDT